MTDMRPNYLTDQTPPERFVGAYGPHWTSGVLTEHLDLFERAGGRVRPAPNDRLWAVLPDGRAYPVVCSELVEVATEDGPMAGRCGEPATDETGLCPGHDYLSPMHADVYDPRVTDAALGDPARYAAGW